ncbi:hypothetical protein CR513_20912, partial [Mucuna pruriens]
MKILNEAHVTHNISLNKFGSIIDNITTNNYITFTNDKVPIEGREHNKALHISIKHKLIIIFGEENLLVSKLSTTHYIEAAKEALETSFQSLEIMGTTYVEILPKKPQFSNATMMIVKIIISGGYQSGHG